MDAFQQSKRVQKSCENFASLKLENEEHQHNHIPYTHSHLYLMQGSPQDEVKWMTKKHLRGSLSPVIDVDDSTR